MASLDYAGSGVDREAADRFVEKIAVMARGTVSRSAKSRVKASVGGYASIFALDQRRWLAASTDGVGTKLKLAFRLRDHRTVGIDLVAMSVNDLLCVGAEPLFFLDYFATGKLDPGTAEQVLEGIVEGCKRAGCALVGGETAEMPEFYAAGEYDLGGFAVGSVDPKQVLPRDREIRPGDVLIGIASSGCHSNGYSLLRKLIPVGAEGDALARRLLTPTRIYSDAVLPLIKKRSLLGLAHITGSGFLNVPRMSEKVSYEIELPPVSERAEIFEWLYGNARLGLGEMARTFNLGIGMVLVAKKAQVPALLKHLGKSGEKAWEVGRVVPRAKAASSIVRVTDPAFEGARQTAELVY